MLFLVREVSQFVFELYVRSFCDYAFIVFSFTCNMCFNSLFRLFLRCAANNARRHYYRHGHENLERLPTAANAILDGIGAFSVVASSNECFSV